MRLCIMPGCHEPERADGFCAHHDRKLTRSLLGGDWLDPSQSTGSTVTLWPARPKRITDALHALAETPGLTTSEYERKKAQILEGDHA